MITVLRDLLIAVLVVVYPVGLLLKALYIVRLQTVDYSELSKDSFEEQFYFFKYEDEVLFWSVWNKVSVIVFVYALVETFLYLERIVG